MDAGFLLHELVTSCGNLLLLHYNVVIIDFIPLLEDSEASLLLKRQGKDTFFQWVVLTLFSKTLKGFNFSHNQRSAANNVKPKLTCLVYVLQHFHWFKASNHFYLDVIIFKKSTSKCSSLREEQSFICLWFEQGSAVCFIPALPGSSVLTGPGAEDAFPGWFACSLSSWQVLNRIIAQSLVYLRVAFPLPELGSSLCDSWILKERILKEKKLREEFHCASTY